MILLLDWGDRQRWKILSCQRGILLVVFSSFPVFLSHLAFLTVFFLTRFWLPNSSMLRWTALFISWEITRQTLGQNQCRSYITSQKLHFSSLSLESPTEETNKYLVSNIHVEMEFACQVQRNKFVSQGARGASDDLPPRAWSVLFHCTLTPHWHHCMAMVVKNRDHWCNWASTRSDASDSASTCARSVVCDSAYPFCPISP